jgi:hypothetical protein
MDFRFCNFYAVNAWYHVWAGNRETGDYLASYDSVVNWTMRDCNLHGGKISLGTPDNGSFYGIPYTTFYGSGAVTWNNNLFENVLINLQPTFNWYDGTVNVDLAFQAHNNLFRGGSGILLFPVAATAGNWVFKDNLFDHLEFYQDAALPLDFDYNGYWPLKNLLYSGDVFQLQSTTTGDGTVDGLNEVVLNSAPPYQAGPFGNYYLPNTTPLYGTGSRTAGNAGLAQYTTSTNQTKEGATHTVNIGLHYVAATNGVPKDSDNDGVPDYVEDANGNGAVDGNETNPNNAMSDGSTPDAYNSVYDDIDLSGDGLTGSAKRFFGTNPLIQDNPLSLLAVPQQSTLSGIVQIPLNINTNVDTNTMFLLNVNENTDNTFVYQTNGNWFVLWDTTAMANGNYRLQLEYPMDDVNSAYGSTLFVNVQNAVSFPNDLSRCGTALFTQPQTINTNGTYTLDVYNDQTNLIAEVSGDVDGNGFCLDPDTGGVGVTVSLLDTNGNESASTYYTADVTTYPPSVEQRQFRPNYSGGSSPSHGKRRFGHEGPWNGARGWVMAYMPIYNDGTTAATDLVDLMANAATQVLNRYGTEGILNGEYTSGGGYASAMPLQESRDWNSMLALLHDDSSHNLYYFGHAGKSLVGKRASSHITGEDLQFTLSSSPNPLATNANSHVYRFVFLDGCQSAAGDLPVDFGIDKRVMPDNVWNKAGLPPRAFLGWSSYTGTAFKSDGTVIEDHTRMRYMNNFWQNWGGDQGLQNALHNASADADSNFQRFCEFDNQITLYGCPTLPFYQ